MQRTSAERAVAESVGEGRSREWRAIAEGGRGEREWRAGVESSRGERGWRAVAEGGRGEREWRAVAEGGRGERGGKGCGASVAPRGRCYRAGAIEGCLRTLLQGR